MMRMWDKISFTFVMYVWFERVYGFFASFGVHLVATVLVISPSILVLRIRTDECVLTKPIYWYR